ncbi:uncharacterized protein PV09_09662 [Verruconis gallopava]|uniref:Uncharacterized protein n=1 Tax=Verruconis gallopava TaxID=253628 RepID=A0A0D1ZWZ9_9PEZI|nr:uncharacterized protein PV09_09662 [Verruconis gallopava]KIV98524.1 hypothetical protein PV09_09662 [Verruconis gallopava]
MADSKSLMTDEASSVDDRISEGSSQPSIIMESCLPGNNFSQVMQDLLLFESQIERRFLTTNAVYRYTCGNTNCGFTCGVPHLMLIVRVRGLADDQVGIILQSAEKPIENILPQVPKPRYSYRTWRNSRWNIIRRMLLCLFVYYTYGDMQRICRLTTRPLHVCVLGGIMGRVLDLQKRFLLANPEPEYRKPQDRERDMLLAKEIML